METQCKKFMNRMRSSQTFSIRNASFDRRTGWVHHHVIKWDFFARSIHNTRIDYPGLDSVPVSPR